MAITSYGLATGEYEAQPNFRASRDAKGAYTGSNSFKMRVDTWEEGVKDTFTKGTPINALFTQLAAFWSFLELESWEIARGEGGIVEVICQYTGFNDAEYQSDREVTYILSGTRVERSILLHPLYIKEMGDEPEGLESELAQAFRGEWSIDTTATISDLSLTVRSNFDRQETRIWTSENLVKWGKTILIQGNRTYKAPTLQWTLETANLSGFTDSDVEHLGLTEFKGSKSPPGNPPNPFHGYFEWMLISLNETRTSGKSSNSKTWELSPPNGFHRFPGEEVAGGKGLYNYDLSELA